MKQPAKSYLSAREVAKISIVAAIYVVLTVLPPLNTLAYGPVQFRVSEVMNFLAFYNKRYIWGVVLGVFVSNLFSSNVVVVDMVVGTAQSLIILLIAVWMFEHVFKGRYFPSFVFFILFDSVVGMAIIAAELLLVYKSPFLTMWVTIAAGEATVLAAGALVTGLLGRTVDLTK